MPTDAAENLAKRTRNRAILRSAIGVTVAFAIAQIINWTLAYMTALFVALLLQAPKPLPVKAGLYFVLVSVAASIAGYALAVFVLPYPGAAALLIVLLLANIFYLGARGGSPLLVVFGLIAVLVLPLLGQTSPDLTGIVAVALVINIAIAVLLSWLAFLVVPALDTGAVAPAKPPVPDEFDATIAALKMTAVVGAIALLFLSFEWGLVLALINAAILAQQLSADSGTKAAAGMLAANLLGGIAAVLIYYFLIAAPSLPLLLMLLFVAALLFGEKIYSGKPEGKLWASAFTTILLILGGILSPTSDGASAKLADRLWQIGLAALYVAFAYTLLNEMIRHSKKAGQYWSVTKSFTIESFRKVFPKNLESEE
jgi:uncharacterized membrane protein YccC